MSAVVEERDGALFVRVQASPGASRDKVQGVYGDALKIATQAPPEGGKANVALCRVLSRLLGLRASQVLLVSGQTSRRKSFRIDGLTPEELKTRFAKILDSAK